MTVMATEKLGAGDEVIVTRSTPGMRTTWRGVIVAGDAETGFSLRGVCLTTGNAEHSWFSGAEVLKRMYGCVQTVTRAEAKEQ